MNHILPEPTKEQIAELARGYLANHESKLLQGSLEWEQRKSFRKHLQKDFHNYLVWVNNNPIEVIRAKYQPRIFKSHKKYRKILSQEMRLERRREWQRTYYLKNKRRILEKARARNKNRYIRVAKEQIKDSSQPLQKKVNKYYYKNKEKILLKAKEYYHANKQTLKERAHKYYEANRERILNRTRKKPLRKAELQG